MYKTEKQDVIMVRPFTKPDDVHGMLAAKGILTSEGGATSHAAVVARQFGVPCVVGAADIQIDMNLRQMTCHGITVKGDWISSTVRPVRFSLGSWLSPLLTSLNKRSS